MARGSAPVVASAIATVSANDPSRSCRSETLIITVTELPVSARHLTACAQASVRTHRPIGTMRPLSSATERKSAGASIPCSGSSHRSSVSTAVTVPVSRS
jgi:hypothetical protein